MLNDWDEKNPPELVAVDMEDLAIRGNHAIEDALEKKRRGEMVLPPPEPESLIKSADHFIERDEQEDFEVDLSEMCAMEVRKLLRTREIDSQRLVESWCYRYKAVDDEIKSTPIEYAVQALDYAKRKAASVEDEHEGHLIGMPVLMKGVSALKGFPRFDGFYGKENGPMPDASSWIVMQIQQTGGIIIGSTNIPEFAAGGHCFNQVYPTTANPYDLRRTAGGSSGGSAAALASRQCWLALGSDLGGSLRTPAAFCGVCGFRVTPGLVPRGDPPPGVNLGKIQSLEDFTRFKSLTRRYDLHSVEGPMARTIFDIAVLMDALTWPLFGPDVIPGGWEGLYSDELRALPYPPRLPRDTTWVQLVETGFYRRKRCKVAITKLGCDDILRDDIFQLIYGAARTIASDDFDLVTDPWPLDVAERVFYALRAKHFQEKFLSESSPIDFSALKPEVQWNATSAKGVDFDKAFHDNEHVIAPAVLKFFENVDVLCAPATIDLPFAKELRYPQSRYGSLKQGGEDLGGGGPADGYRDYMHWLKPTYLVSVTECPALVMPCGTLEDGLPVGIQLIAKPGNDQLLLQIAASLEAALDLDFRLGIEQPRTGTEPLVAIGPKTADEAKAHHDIRPPLD